MSELQRVDLGSPLLLEFSGPDAMRFLNGQLTQDVRRVVGQTLALPSCVTDVKGKLQYRVYLMEAQADVFWVSGLAEWAEMLEARLTRYLIADDVTVTDLSSTYQLAHLLGPRIAPPPGVLSRDSDRYGELGMDWWIPTGQEAAVASIPEYHSEALEALRVAAGVPAWGRELSAGLLPPEALLDVTDCSYHKGCYIGQEVISRIKSAGKVNKKLTRFTLDSEAAIGCGLLENGAGEITSVSPVARGAVRDVLGYAKRSATEFFLKAQDGTLHSLRPVEA
jgi:tRNA-modifying protein YgfZ